MWHQSGPKMACNSSRIMLPPLWGHDFVNFHKSRSRLHESMDFEVSGRSHRTMLVVCQGNPAAGYQTSPKGRPEESQGAPKDRQDTHGAPRGPQKSPKGTPESLESQRSTESPGRVFTEPPDVDHTAVYLIILFLQELPNIHYEHFPYLHYLC